MILRDRTLASMVTFGLLMGVALRYLLPFLDLELAARGVLPNESTGMRLSDVYPMLVTYFALFNGAQLSGAIFGFLLLDEKDQRTFVAVQVSPVSIKRFAACRLVLPSVLGFLQCTAMVSLIGQAALPFWKQIAVTAVACVASPIMALFLATFADNKIQGFAIAKFAGIAGWTILFGWFLAEPWHWLFGLLFPPFLASKAYWMALDGVGFWWVVLLLGLVLQLLMVGWLARRLQSQLAKPSGSG